MDTPKENIITICNNSSSTSDMDDDESEHWDSYLDYGDGDKENRQ